MIITYPKVCLYWHNPRLGICGVEDFITDIKSGKYGYKLTDGAKIYCADYWGDKPHAMTTYDLEVEKVTEEGIYINNWLCKGWETDNLARAGLAQEDKAFLPWNWNGLELVLQPFESLYENYKLKGIIEGTTPTSNGYYKGNKWVSDPRGEGYFYRHGGWRSKTSKYIDNLQNLVAINEQLELEL